MRRRRVAIAAEVVPRLLLEGGQLLSSSVSGTDGHGQTGRLTLDRVSGSTSHMALEAMPSSQAVSE